MLQDYLYLLQYAKVFAIAAVKSQTEDLMVKFSTSQYYTLTKEMELHRKYMAGFGLTGNLPEVLAAVFPCAWTYADYGKRLKEQYAGNLDKNFYKSWIEMYSSAEFSDSFEWFYNALDNLVVNMSDEQREKIVEIFISSVEFEYLFWDMAYNQQMSYKQF